MAQTTAYLYLALSIVIGTLGLYILSLALRLRNARKDVEHSAER